MNLFETRAIMSFATFSGISRAPFDKDSCLLVNPFSADNNVAPIFLGDTDCHVKFSEILAWLHCFDMLHDPNLFQHFTGKSGVDAGVCLHGGADLKKPTAITQESLRLSVSVSVHARRDACREVKIPTNNSCSVKHFVVSS